MNTILVVGCGITGSVVGTMLAKKGYKVMIVERVAKIEDVGGALAIWPNGYVSTYSYESWPSAIMISLLHVEIVTCTPALFLLFLWSSS